MKPRDTRLQQKRASRDLTRLLDDALHGRETGREGAERHGLRVLVQLVQAHLLDEGPLGTHLRAFVDALCQLDDNGRPVDSMRADLGHEVWAALWPTFNALRRGRAQQQVTFEKRREALARASAAPSPAPEATPDDGKEARHEEG